MAARPGESGSIGRPNPRSLSAALAICPPPTKLADFREYARAASSRQDLGVTRPVFLPLVTLDSERAKQHLGGIALRRPAGGLGNDAAQEVCRAVRVFVVRSRLVQPLRAQAEVDEVLARVDRSGSLALLEPGIVAEQVQNRDRLFPVRIRIKFVNRGPGEASRAISVPARGSA